MISPWRWFLPRSRIGIRIVAAVVLAMSLVLVAAGGFVYWRVAFALDQQLDQDLRAYTDVVAAQVADSGLLPAANPGEASQIYSDAGRLLASSGQRVPRLLTPSQVSGASAAPARGDLGSMVPASERPYRVRYLRVTSPRGPVVVAAAISRRQHDEALRELLGQLAVADLATVLAAGLVGWGATRAAFGPVERYRRAAAAAGGDPRRRLPVETGRDDELTRLGTTFNALLEEIEEGQVRERQFLADASHELRSPLALMAAEVEWARHRPRTDAELARVLESVGDQTQRLVALSNALLDIEEVHAAEVDRTPVRLTELVADALVVPNRLAQQAGRTIGVDVPAGVVRVDRRWMGLAVSNLATNAIRHGAGTVAVTAGVLPDGGSVWIQVVDEGGGIPDDLGRKAFDRFARGDESRSTPGSGLGLALVAAVAERHGGAARLVPGGIRIELPGAGA